MTASRLEETYDAFLELERSQDLFDLRIDGVPVWERVRKDVFDDLVLGDVPEAVRSDAGDAEGSTGFLRYLVDRGYRDLTVENPLLAGQHDLVFVNGRRERMSDGVWWNIYCDPVCEALGIDCLHLDPSDHYRRSPLKTDAVRPIRPLSVIGSATEKIRRSRKEIPPSVAERLATVEESIAASFDREVRVTERVRRQFARRSRLLPLFERTLRRVDPEVAVSIPSWAGREVFIEACKHEGIPVIEMQHGSPNRYHLGYSYPHGTKEMFPDYLFMWGEFWTEQIAFPIPDDRVRHVGFPSLQSRREEHPPTDRSDRLVVVSQPTVGEELSRLAVGLAEHEGIDLEVSYKLHPVEYDGWQDAYPRLARSDLRVVGSDGPGLYDLFGRAAAQVGVYSTAIYEGLAYDLRTFLLDIDEVGFMDQLVATGAVDVVSSADEVAAKVGDPPGGDLEIDRLFRPNAIDNVRRELDAIRD